MGKKIISLLLTAALMVTTMGMAAAAVPQTVQGKLALIEEDTYGSEQTGAVMDRLNKLEKDYDGSHRSGSLMARIDALYNEVYKNAAGPSMLARLNAIEWNIDHEVSMKPVETRLADMELGLMGKTEEGTFKARIDKLGKASFGAEALPIEKVQVPANTLIKVATVDAVNAKNLKAGDTVRFKVAEDVIVDGSLIFAKGEPGEGTVEKVRQAKNFGRNAEVQIDFHHTKSIDGTEVDTYVGEESKKEMKHLAMAAGASIAGMLLLGPIGIIGGAFVKGKNVDVPAGTELFIETENEESLYGVATAQAD